jgi:hypothetical protein
MQRLRPGQSLNKPLQNVVKNAPSREKVNDENAVVIWNLIAIDTSGIDHTFTKKDQGGPTRASRAMAMVQIAVADTLALITKAYQPYYSDYMVSVTGKQQDSAIASAAVHVLSQLFPQQSSRLQKLYDDFMSRTTRDDGSVELGKKVAAHVLAQREQDGSQHPEPVWGASFNPENVYCAWQKDPFSKIPVALGANWGQVKPFVLKSSTQFRVPAFPSLSSPEFGKAYLEAKRLGGDGTHTPTERTSYQTETGIFWAYDGTPSLCAPPRLYNLIALQIAKQKNIAHDAVEMAKYYALINVALADAAIACWESKYHYNIGRPVTVIREAVTTPTVQTDPKQPYGSSDTVPDATWTPIGVPISNGQGVNVTPNFPSYPSGHGTFGGALFQVIRNYFKTDDIPFTFTSEEYNGKTLGPDGNTRPERPRTFKNLSEAEEENGQSRIYLGIHWEMDKTTSITQGNQVGDFITSHIYQ